jgi:hypothetical protein
MTFIRLATVVSRGMDKEMARIESGGQLLQDELLGGPLRSFEQDDRTASVRDLRELQFAKMIP